MNYENDPCVPVVPHAPDAKFKLEAVVVCDRYHDFLRCTLPQNKFLFDKIVVVTSPEDRETQRVCEFYHVECVLTDALRSRWKQFCKGAGINEGLARLSKRDWVVHLDADIWLPPLTRNLLANANLAKRMIYGIDRFIVRGYRAWDQFLELPKLQHECNAFVHLNNSFPLGTRIMQDYAGGYVPIGFFQLWHPRVSGIMKYPEGHTTAGREDTLFPQQWPRGLRGFIPELIGYHLESLDSGFGTNWKGRKTAGFSFEESVSRL
ncbi:MAG TPA: glycosyltransferase family A protein [Terriglobales bacterium]|nr:glycosyltransferase family A protein [Terriglobales bacterium]